MAETTTTTRKPRAAKPPALDKAIEALSAALTDPDHPEHQAAVEYVDENFARQAEATIPDGERPRNIIEALVAVMREVRAVGKDGRNTQKGQGYDFRGIDGTVNALGPAMRKVGVIPMPTLKSHQYGEVTVGQNRTQQAHSRVEVEYTFHYSNAEGEHSHVAAYVPGEAMDSGDKATAKSMSVAFRTCLLQTFAVPTHERDPDEDSYERSDAPEPIPVEELRGAIKHAATYEDLDEGFAALRAHYGSRIGVSTGVTSDGEEMPGDAYLEYAKTQWAKFRAEQAAKHQDADAEGKTSEQSEGDEPAEQPPAEQEHGTETVAVGQQQPPAQEQQQPPAEQPPAEQPEQRKAPEPGKTRQQTQKERLLTCAKEELIFQAEVANVPAAEFGAMILTEPGNLDSIHQAKAPRFLVGNRPRVINILRERGDATVAEAYESIGQGFPILVSDITGQR